MRPFQPSEQDNGMFLRMHQSSDGKHLIEYLERLIASVSDLENLNDDNFKAAKFFVTVVREQVIDRIRRVNMPKMPPTNQSYK